MTPNYDDERPPWRDLAAVIFLVLAAAGLVVAAFATDWRLGLATASLAVGAGGAVLGSTRY